MAKQQTPTPKETVTVADYGIRDHARLGRVGVVTVGPPEHSRRPPTLGPQSTANLDAAVRRADDDARNGQVAAVAITGTGNVFLAGADLDIYTVNRSPEFLTELGDVARGVVARLLDAPVPTLAHLNGAALGGGLEVALPADLITASPGVRAIGLPEVSLGFLPSWGGTTLLTLRIGAENALSVIVDRAQNGRPLNAVQARDIGLVGALVDDVDAALDALADAIDAGTAGPDSRSRALRGGGEALTAPESSGAVALLDSGSTDAERLRAAVDERRQLAHRLEVGGAPAARTVLDIVEQLPGSTLSVAFGRENDALTTLGATDAVAGSLYSAALLRGARPPRTPFEGARQIRSVGVVGAGQMGSQITAALAVNLRVPVTLHDLSDEGRQAGLEAARNIIATAAEKGRLSADDAQEVSGALSAATSLSNLADCDLVVEAVSEQLDIKKGLLAELETVVSAEAVLVTNTSALSIAAMSEGLAHPERVLGLHFFNPVARMPLVEIVLSAQTAADVADTGREIVRRLGKTGIESSDSPGFVVNRVLFRLMSEVLRARDAGASQEAVDSSLAPMSLPMTPSELLDLIGDDVVNHVGAILVADLGERFYAPGVSPAPGRSASDDQANTETGEALLVRVRESLADEVRRMLDDGVVTRVQDIDLALILGAGWPEHNGGISPYLDWTGASASVGRFHDDQFTS